MGKMSKIFWRFVSMVFCLLIISCPSACNQTSQNVPTEEKTAEQSGGTIRRSTTCVIRDKRLRGDRNWWKN
jgi:hypothetical protein